MSVNTDIITRLHLMVQDGTKSDRRLASLVLAEPDFASKAAISEIAARISEDCFDDLDAPVGRVGGLNVPMPYARVLELECIPNEDDVIVQVHKF